MERFRTFFIVAGETLWGRLRHRDFVYNVANVCDKIKVYPSTHNDIKYFFIVLERMKFEVLSRSQILEIFWGGGGKHHILSFD